METKQIRVTQQILDIIEKHRQNFDSSATNSDALLFLIGVKKLKGGRRGFKRKYPKLDLKLGGSILYNYPKNPAPFYRSLKRQAKANGWRIQFEYGQNFITVTRVL